MRLIVIVADALRADHLSCYDGKVQTPNIDILAQKGVLHKTFFANSNATEPCITTMLTGHYPHNHKILKQPSYTTYKERMQQKIPPEIAEHHICSVLMKAGFTTVLIDNLTIFNKPFFRWYQFVESGLRTENNAEETVKITKRTLEMLKTHDNAFIFIHFWNTHHPYFPDYPGEVRKLDQAIGQLFDDLDLDKDRIIFTADHGESIGEHVTEARKDDPGHHHLYDEIIHIPLILSGSFDIMAPEGEFLEQIDLAPLMLKMAGVEYAPGWYDVRTQFTGKSNVFLEEHTYQHQIGFRTDTFKYMEKIGDNLQCPLCHVIHGRSRYELYHLKNNPEEDYNLAPYQPFDSLRDMHNQVWRWYEQ